MQNCDGQKLFFPAAPLYHVYLSFDHFTGREMGVVPILETERRTRILCEKGEYGAISM